MSFPLASHACLGQREEARKAGEKQAETRSELYKQRSQAWNGTSDHRGTVWPEKKPSGPPLFSFFINCLLVV